MPNLYLPAAASVISLILLLVYVLKKRLMIRENKIFRAMLIAILCDSLIVSFIFVTAYTNPDVSFDFLVLLNRIDFMFLFTWATCLFMYTYIVIHKEDENFDRKYKCARFITLGVTATLVIIMWHLPIDIIMIDIVKCTAQGAGVNFAIVGCVSYFFLSFLVIVFNPKKATRKVLPVFISLLITVIIAGLFLINPYIICISMGLTVVNLTMYFTIENPDMQMLEIVNEAKEQAMRASAAKTDFLSSMSHEIRTPLNAIVGLSECILDENDFALAKEDAKDIVNASNTLLELVNGILDISKIEAGRMEIVNKEYDLTDVASTLSKIVKTRIGDKPLKLNISFSNNIPGCLYGDEAKMRQIMTNILTNAIKYTEKGEVNFSIECSNENEISTIVITISDSGRGIKPEELDKLFEKFRRLDEDKNSAIEGTGLGLAITKKLVDMLNGKIEVSSVYGQGTTFTVTVPQTIVSLEKKDKNENRGVMAQYPGKKILIVDDIALNLKVASKILGVFKIDSQTAISGKACLEICKNEKFDLILMDDMMPEMCGKETMDILRKDESFETPVVALTANAIEGMKAKYIREGFDDYIMKPIDRKDLQRVLDKFL